MTIGAAESTSATFGLEIVKILFAAGVGAAFTAFLQRYRPNFILVRRVSATTLTRISAQVRSRIKVEFDGIEIRNLSHAVFEISNESKSVIHNVRVSIEFQGDARILSCEIEDAGNATADAQGASVLFSVPAINPRRGHGERFVLRVLCDGDVRQLALSGSGDGWTIRAASGPRGGGIMRASLTVLLLLGVSGLIGLTAHLAMGDALLLPVFSSVITMMVVTTMWPEFHGLLKRARRP